MNDNEKPELGEPTPAEREAATYWSRQIGTALALGNAGGIATLAGFASNLDDIKIAAMMTYPAVSYFLAGVVWSFASLGAQFIYTSLRLEAKAEINEKQIEWQKSQNIKPRIDIISTILFFLYLAILHASLVFSGYYFLRGSIQVSNQAAALYCASTTNSVYCKTAPVYILGHPSRDQIVALKELINNSDNQDKGKPEPQKPAPENQRTPPVETPDHIDNATNNSETLPLPKKQGSTKPPSLEANVEHQ